jgi:hypothetical protein
MIAMRRSGVSPRAQREPATALPATRGTSQRRTNLRQSIAALALLGAGTALGQSAPSAPAAGAAVTTAVNAAFDAERCLQPDSNAMAARCELRHRYCAKPPNAAWRTRWRVVCGGTPGGALSGSATVDGGSGRRAFKAEAQVIWLPKADSRTQYVPYGTLTFTGKSRECSASETVDIGPEDGELEIKPGSGGPAQYRGAGFKAMDIRVLCTRAAGVIAGGTGSETKSDAKSDARRAAAMAAAGVTAVGPPVPWFNTAEAFRAPQGGLLEGEMKDPDGNWTWRWNFKP